MSDLVTDSAATAEPVLARWRRRAVTIPGYLAGAALALAGLPLWLALAALLDAARARGWIATRFVLFLTFYLTCESLALVIAFALWLGYRVGRPSHDRYLDWNFRLQCGWAATLLRGGGALYGLRFELEGEDALRSGPEPRPLLVFIRHTSVADTMLPAVFLSARHAIRLRYVMKREVLWEPCIDVAGQRLQNAFVRRDSGASEREVGVVRGLAQGLPPGHGVLIYPEGTRSTPEKRARALDRIARSSDSRVVDRARALRHLMPPRLGGPLALLDACPGADVLLVAHTGLEEMTNFRELWRGVGTGGRVALRLWRARAEDVPRARDAAVDWLYTEWRRMDDWVDAARGEPPADAAAAAGG